MKKVSSFSEKKGGFSLLYVIVIFIAMLIAIGFLDILSRNFHMNELQSSMDIAGVSALQKGVDETKLHVGFRDENGQLLDNIIDVHAVESTYKQFVRDFLNDSNEIIDYRFVKTDVEFDPNSTYGLGQTSKGRPQALIDSTVVIVVDNSQMFDLVPGAYKTYYDSKDGTFFDVNFLGTTEDGKVELMIRSVSRIVYR